MRPQRAALITLLSAALLVACGSQVTEEGDVREEVRLLFPSELAPVFGPEIAAFNALRPKTSSGAVVSIIPFQADGPLAASRVLADQGDKRAAILISPSTLATQAIALGVSRQASALGQCKSLATTDLGFGVRESDAFALDEQNGSTSLQQLNRQSKNSDPAKQPLLVLPVPGATASGLPIFAMQASVALGVRLDSLAAQPLKIPDDALRATQASVARYFRGEAEMLRWLRTRMEPQPAIALTSRQQVHAANTAKGGARLLFVSSALPNLSLDYPLCDVVSASATASSSEARQLVLRHFSGPAVQSLIRSLSFTTSSDNLTTEHRFQNGVGAALLDAWPKVRKPASIALVVDTSSGVPPALLSAVSRELSSFIRWDTVAGDSIGLVATSTRPELLSPITPDLKKFQRSLELLRPSGIAVPIDGAGLALSSLDALPPSASRQALVVVASQRDAGSASSLSAMRQKLSQSLQRTGAAAYVVGVQWSPVEAGPPEDLKWLQSIAAELGAEYVQSPLGTLPETLRAVLQRVE